MQKELQTVLAINAIIGQLAMLTMQLSSLAASNDLPFDADECTAKMNEVNAILSKSTATMAAPFLAEKQKAKFN